MILKIIIFLLLSTSIYAQFFLNTAKITGSGSSTVAYSRGIEAIYSNPANIAFFDRKNCELSFIPSVNINFQNSVFSIKDYKNYFTGNPDKSPKELTDQDKSNIMSLFNNENYETILISSSISIINLFLNYKQLSGGFCFGISEKMMSINYIPKEAFKLILYGNSLNTNYNFTNLTGTGIWYREYSLGYGFQYYNNSNSKASFGIILKYLEGKAYYNINNINSNLNTTDTSINGTIKINLNYAYPNFLNENYSYSFFESSGKGQSLDIGLSYNYNESIFLGLCLQDIGYINWDKNVYQVQIDTIAQIKNIFEEEEYKPLNDLFNNHKNKLKINKIYLPISLSAGLTVNLQNASLFNYKFSFPFLCNFQFTRIQKNMLLNKSYNIFSFGLDLKPLYWLPIRFGYITNQISSNFSFGTGINTSSFDFDIAFGDIKSLFLLNSTKSIIFSISTKFLF